MIVQTFMVILILSVVLICDVTGTSYSNVYVESEVVPIGYYSYGTPYPSIANPRLSQINSLPSVPGYVAPCVSPCVYPAQTVPTVTPVSPSQNVLTYNAPNVPIVVAPTKQEATGYEYSYVVYDENTGDHKAQRELSDGSVVQGEYSFLQPDGYVRQVQYVADDISGFNAVVNQYLPTAVEGHRKVAGQENKEYSPPCHEVKNESLKEESEENSGEISIKKLMKNDKNLHNKHSNEESAEKSKDHHGTSKESGEEENSKEKHHKETKKVFKEKSSEESEEESHENQSKKPKHSKEESGEESAQKSKEKPQIKHKHSKEESGEESEEKLHFKPKHSKEKSGEESAEKSIEKYHSKSKKVSNEHSGEESEEKEHKKGSKESGEESKEESKEELKEKSGKKTSKGTEESREKNKKKSMKGSKEGSDEDSAEESVEVSNGKHKEVHALLKPNQEALVPQKDILRCIEAAMRRNYGVPAAMRQEPSPLSYIVLNKPC